MDFTLFFNDTFKVFFNIILLPFIIGLFASITTVLIYEGVKYRRYFNALCAEIKNNYDKMQNKEFENQKLRMYNIHEKCLKNPQNKEWVGFAKTISLWISIQEMDKTKQIFYRYLSNNDFKNFINHGYYSSTQENSESLFIFYFACEQFSDIDQKFENQIFINRERFADGIIGDYTDDIRKKNLDIYINLIDAAFHSYQDLINKEYPNLKKSFQKIRIYEINKWLFKF
jgi:hypothetical protein